MTSEWIHSENHSLRLPLQQSSSKPTKCHMNQPINKWFSKNKLPPTTTCRQVTSASEQTAFIFSNDPQTLTGSSRTIDSITTALTCNCIPWSHAQPQIIYNCTALQLARIKQVLVGTIEYSISNNSIVGNYRINCMFKKFECFDAYNKINGPIRRHFGKQMNKETKSRIPNIAAKAALKFGSEVWVLKKREEQRLEAAQMKFLRHLLGITKLDKEKNQCIRQKTGAQNITKEIKQYQEKWLQHV